MRLVAFSSFAAPPRGCGAFPTNCPTIPLISACLLAPRTAMVADWAAWVSGTPRATSLSWAAWTASARVFSASSTTPAASSTASSAAARSALRAIFAMLEVVPRRPSRISSMMLSFFEGSTPRALSWACTSSWSFMYSAEDSAVPPYFIRSLMAVSTAPSTSPRAALWMALRAESSGTLIPRRSFSMVRHSVGLMSTSPFGSLICS